MPRRDEPQGLPDDRPRRARPSGGGVPVWVWVAGAAGVVAVFGCCGGVGLYAWVAQARRADERAAEVERQAAEVARRVAEQEAVDADELWQRYKADPTDVSRRYSGGRVAVRLRVDAVRRYGDDFLVEHAAGAAPGAGKVVAWIPTAESGRVKSGEWVTVFGSVTDLLPHEITLRGRLTP